MRRCALRLLLGAGLLAASVNGFAAAPSSGASSRAELAARIDAQIGQLRFAAASWGIAVVSLDSGQTVYAHQADRLRQPVSTAKLFTAALALAMLGPDCRFFTRLLAGAPVVHGRLNGPLILYGMGDPTLGTSSSPDWADNWPARQRRAV
ncbi:MAG: D-alanyl-D-alanine carboxypeptidase [Rhodanobacter sp.]